MKIWAPWETAWPAGLALLLLLGATFAARSWLRLPRGHLGPVLGLFALGLLLRLLAVPALAEHVYDGHEAEFFDIFTGARARNRGGTVLYPSLQWMWWGLGKLLPHAEWVPVVLMAAVGSASAWVVGATAGRLAANPDAPQSSDRVAWIAALVVLLHPVHAAWSSSAYNVILPFFFSALVLWSAAVVGQSRHPPLAVASLGAAAWVLVVATRMEVALVGLPAAVLALGLRPAGLGRGEALRRRAVLLLPLIPALLLGGLAAYPLLFPGEVPGAGERALAFAINWPLVEFYLPVAPRSLLALPVALCTLWALREAPFVTAVLLLSALGQHLLMASFDDFGDRHTLSALPALAWVLALAGGSGWGRPWHRPGALGLALVALLLGLVQLRERYYATEDAFVAWQLARTDLPEMRLEDARQNCGWINEDPRAAADPVASHFNVLDPVEVAALRGPGGCLRWCADVQDYRWSSRAVADRALRMRRLYALSAVAVVSDPASGYACVAWEVGPRRCCGEEPALR